MMNTHGPRLRRTAIYIAVRLALALVGTAHAFEIDSGNPDVKMRLDNTVRYNLGVRAERQDAAIINTPPFDASDLKFDRGDVMTNRLDLLSEFDFIYKKNHGFRISGAAWYDHAYRDTSVAGVPGFYPNNQYTGEVKRYIYGPSGELLDAFLFTTVNAGDVPVSLKLGRHTTYWGESLFTAANGISYSQGPLDAIKASSSPGSQAKELFMPSNQLSAVAQLTNELSVGAQYYLEWDAWRLPYGGTYFGGPTFFTGAGGTFLAPGLPFNGIQNRPDNRGDWGVMARWTPGWLGGTAGAYYRSFDEKLPWFAVSGTGAFLNYARDTKLYGLSYSTSVQGVSVGTELSYRKNTALNSAGVVDQGARGDTWHALVNVIQYFGSTPLWAAAPLTAELNYTRLGKVSSNEALFNRGGTAACAGGIAQGCSTKDALSLDVLFEPVWYQVMPGVDLKMPIYYSRGLAGNGPALGSSSKGTGLWSVGLAAEIQNEYFVTLKYTDYMHKMTTNGATVTSFNGGALNKDRGWVSLSLKTTF